MPKFKTADNILEIQLFSQALYLFLVPKGCKHCSKVKITLSLMVFEINDIFNFRQNSGNSTFLRGTTCNFSSTHWVQNCCICYGFLDKWYFRFPSRFNMAAEIQEIQHFSKALHLRSHVQKGPKFSRGGKTIFEKSRQ